MSADGNNPDVAAELAAILAKRSALAEARELRQQITPSEQLAQERRALADDEKLDQLEAEHGKIGSVIDIVRTDSGAVIVRRPHMAVFRRFQDDPKNSKALEQLTRPCVLHPSKAEFDQMCQDLPFLLQKCADAVCVLAGVPRETERTKP